MCDTRLKKRTKNKAKTRADKALKQAKLTIYTLKSNMHGYNILPHEEKLEKSMARIDVTEIYLSKLFQLETRTK